MAPTSGPAEAPMNRLVALVPMRHRSERVSGKNFRQIAGRPLYSFILETLLAVEAIDQVVVDTDSPVIKSGLRDGFPSVTVLDRPAELAAPEASMNEVILWDVAQVPAEHYLQTHSTNPLLRPETVARAAEAYFGGLGVQDSLFSVTRLQKRLWTQDARPLNHDPANLIQTQNLPLLFEENSCLYFFSRLGMVQRRNRIGHAPALFEIPADEAWDIDNQVDMEIVAALLSMRNP